MKMLLKNAGVSIHFDSVHIIAAALSGQAQQRFQAGTGRGIGKAIARAFVEWACK